MDGGRKILAQMPVSVYNKENLFLWRCLMGAEYELKFKADPEALRSIFTTFPARWQTIQMQTTYHRPLIPGQETRTIVRVLSTTKSLMHLCAECYSVNAPEKLCLTASGTYFFKPFTP